MTIQEFVYTLPEFETLLRQPENNNRSIELIHGTVVEKMAPTQEHGYIAANVSGELRAHVKPRDLGRVSVETAHTSTDDTYNYRIPDVSFVSGDALTKQGAVPHMPDLAVEIKSPDDSYAELREKANYYLTNGAKLVWLIFPDKQRVEVHTPDEVTTLEADDTLDGGDVLPDFKIAVSVLFD
ncbi:MAG: Uma2 family endonuclease [Chloroflexota bacterium]